MKLHIDHMAFQAVRGFLNGFAQRGVRVDVAGDLARRQLGEPGQRQLRQKFSHVRADHVSAEHLAVFFVADQFDEAGGVAQPLRLAVRREREFCDVDVEAALARSPREGCSRCRSWSSLEALSSATRRASSTPSARA